MFIFGDVAFVLRDPAACEGLERCRRWEVFAFSNAVGIGVCTGLLVCKLQPVSINVEFGDAL